MNRCASYSTATWPCHVATPQFTVTSFCPINLSERSPRNAHSYIRCVNCTFSEAACAIRECYQSLPILTDQSFITGFCFRSSLFWDGTKRGLVVSDRRFGTIIEDGTDRVSRNVGNYQSTLRNILEEPRSLLHRERILKSLTDAFL